MRRAIVVLTVVLPGFGSADEVFLRGGGKMTGEVVSEGGETVVLEVGPGKVSVPAARVLRIERSRSPLGIYRERASRLAAEDVPGWLELAFWADEHDLDTLAKEAFERVLRLDPGNASANGALGRVQTDGRWMTPGRQLSARGYVSVRGGMDDAGRARSTPARPGRRAPGRPRSAKASYGCARRRRGPSRPRPRRAAPKPKRRAGLLRRHSLLVGVGWVGDRAARAPLSPSDSAAEAATRGHPVPPPAPPPVPPPASTGAKRRPRASRGGVRAAPEPGD